MDRLTIEGIQSMIIETHEDWENLNPEILKQYSDCGGRGMIIYFPTSLVFECQWCKAVAPHLNPYRLIKSRTPPQVPTTEGIFPKEGLDSEPEYSSELHLLKEWGYVCDHCFDCSQRS